MVRGGLWFCLLLLRFCHESRADSTDAFWSVSTTNAKFRCFEFCHLVTADLRGRRLVQFCYGETFHCLLLLCGDISPNPGPLRYPCTVCGKSVRSNQRGLLCDSCGKWSHAVCTGFTTSRYDALTAVG